MKIIAGKFKGRVIQMPKGIRPTSDKVREALFEILKGSIEGASFLDLYCGSGAVGIEALSRGAEKLVFVEENAGSTNILKKNLQALGLFDSSSIDIYIEDAERALGLLEEKAERFDVIFLDPPYYKDLARNTLIEISRCDILSKSSFIIAEIYKKDQLPSEVGRLKKIRSAKYGDTLLEFFRLKKGNKYEKNSYLSGEF